MLDNIPKPTADASGGAAPSPQRAGDANGARPILILYLRVGAGHRVAAEAVFQALQRKAPDQPLLLAELAQLTDSHMIKLLPNAYGSLISVAPTLYDYWWHRPRAPVLVELAEKLLSARTLSELEENIARINPCVTICTHALASRGVALLKDRGLDTVHIAVATDFGLNTYWTTTSVDWYIVPAEELKSELAERGVPLDKVRDLGIPTRTTSASTSPPRQIADATNGSSPTVMMMLGGSDRRLYASAARRIVGALQRARRRGTLFEAIVVTGHNKWLRKRLQRRAARWSVPMHVLGYVEDVPALMRKADLLVTKAGGLTVAEALAAGTPLVVVGEPPGQERANVEFLVDHGAGVHAPTGRTLTRALTRLVRHPERLQAMSDHARQLGRPNAADDIAALALSSVRT